MKTAAIDSPRAATAALDVRGRQNTRRVVIASSLGNGLEMYDFTVYSFFAATIGRLFFPSDSALASLLMSLATFAVGFLMRPLGAVLIGRVADRRGRKAALTLTIALMTLGTALIAFTPTYSSIGIAATALLVFGRLLQGLSAGGEVGTASAFLMESGHERNRCFMVSWQGASQGAAALLGALSGLALSSWLSPQELESWGWRIPFVIGLLIGPVGWYIRQNLDETHDGAESSVHRPLAAVLRSHFGTLLLGILLMASATVSMYLVVFYMPTYLTQTLHYPGSTAFALVCLASALLALIPPLAARFADRLPRRKPLLYWTIGLPLLLVYPAFQLLAAGPDSLLLMCAIVALILPLAVGIGAFFALLMEAFPREQRVTGLSIIYSFGVTLFGGLSPLLVTWLVGVTGNSQVPAFYLMAAAALSLLALRLYPEHPGRA